jgi:hypothetical protein
MKYNYRRSLGFLILLLGVLSIAAAFMAYGFLAVTVTTGIEHSFDLPFFASDLMGIGIFLVLPVTVIAGFVQD